MIDVRPLEPHPSFTKPEGPVVIVVADGVGDAPDAPSNAVTRASTPTIDRLRAGPLSTIIAAHGTAVGLPSDDDMGNSEVGHNAIGAGRIFAQGAKLVNQAIASGAMWESPTWKELVHHGRRGTLHLLGLHSDGNVHSHTDHLYAMLHQAAIEGVERCRLHILLDGRDVAARSAQIYIEATEKVLAAINADHGVDYRIASGGGRMTITMDRYGADWPMVERGWRCHTLGEARGFATAAHAVDAMYEESDKGDQYLDAFVIVDDIDGHDEPIGRMVDGDAVLLWNFRGDRAIEISQAYEADEDIVGFDRGADRPDVFFAGLLEYDGDLKVPANYLVDPPEIDATMGEHLAASGLRCFAVSETQKYGHVTFFWNGNRSGYLDEALETYVEIPSDTVPFDEAPEMKAAEITDTVIELIDSGDFDWGRINYANGDMVGHTGNLDATIASMEALDAALARLVEAVEARGGIVIFTADHGNADIMFTDKNGERVPSTSHTTNPVPFVIHGADPAVRMADLGDPGLANIAATTMNLLGLVAPDDYEPSLVSV
ncbi:MAG: 2,3-bisphosphoglycerate-independent phosphoglycerate mutase [Actinomycetota bacterium]